jgi:hypothetical protein
MASEAIVLNGKQAYELFTNGKLEDVVAFYKTHGDSFQLSCVNRNPLHFAADNKDPSVLWYLLKYHNLWRRINEKDDLDNRPLEIAVVRGYIKHLEILLFYGANENLTLKLGHSVAGMLTVMHCLDDADKIVKEFIAKREHGGVLSEEAQLDEEVARINAKLSAQYNKTPGKTLVNHLACSISHWLSFMRPANSPYPTEKPAEQVPLIIKKTM